MTESNWCNTMYTPTWFFVYYYQSGYVSETIRDSGETNIIKDTSTEAIDSEKCGSRFHNFLNNFGSILSGLAFPGIASKSFGNWSGHFCSSACRRLETAARQTRSLVNLAICDNAYVKAAHRYVANDETKASVHMHLNTGKVAALASGNRDRRSSSSSCCSSCIKSSSSNKDTGSCCCSSCP